MQFQRNADIVGEIDRFLNFVGVENYHQTLCRSDRAEVLAVSRMTMTIKACLLVRADIMESAPVPLLLPRFVTGKRGVDFRMRRRSLK